MDTERVSTQCRRGLVIYLATPKLVCYYLTLFSGLAIRTTMLVGHRVIDYSVRLAFSFETLLSAS